MIFYEERDDTQFQVKERVLSKAQLNELVEGLNDADLRALFAIIGGKLGKRKITPEQQAKMQAARKRKVI